ncbi:hypothetical protein [Streptomyces sp. GC420]|uniref:hypothetical protein n=1 Tax=Streptomyces sp. GC420 TaxID=2697568 RepID=UPI0014150C87|nr:hypothetical protein [Streptomyces sp. GC420]NBM20281.1 hypothetical protein [Streptomyces sp. GC420]
MSAVQTTLTPEFWRLFAVLLVTAVAATVVAGLAADACILRIRRRRASRQHRDRRTTSRPVTPRYGPRPPVPHR